MHAHTKRCHLLLSCRLSTNQWEKLQRYTTCSNCCLSTLPTLIPTDINECATNNGNCGADKSCTNTIGSYSCQCKAGYRQLTNGNCQGMEHRDVIALLCMIISNTLPLSDINECSTANICGTNKRCTNTPGSYLCTCNLGYREGRNGQCQGKPKH